MEPEDQAEGLENNPLEEGTLEQPEAEETQAEVVEETQEAEAPTVEVSEEAVREAQRRFTPAQQRLAEELRQEREQRLEMARQLEELRTKLPKVEEPKEPEDPEPDPVMDMVAYQRWLVRQELKPILEKEKRREQADQEMQVQRRAQTDYARLCSAYPDLKDDSSDLAKTFEGFLTSKDERHQRIAKLYRDGSIEAEDLLGFALSSKAPAVAERKVKQDLVRKANAQVSGGQSNPPSGKKYLSVDDVIAEAMREQTKG